MISQTSRYGVRALAELARTGGRPICVRELAIGASVPPPFLGKIMGLLSRRKLVYNQRGRHGGSALQRPAAEIRLYDVCEALDDPVIRPLCLLGGVQCSDDRACPTHEFWRDHQARLIELLRRTTIQEVAEFGTAHMLLHSIEVSSGSSASVRRQERGRGALTLLCGPSGAGKTTYCSDAVRRARGSGLAVGGILSVSEPPDGERVRIVAVDLSTGEQRTLAEMGGSAAFDGPVSGRWQFSGCTIEWASDVLQHATPCDLLVVDELGPLELRRGEGLAVALDVIDNGAYGDSLVTVRPSALPILQSRWPHATVAHLERGKSPEPWNPS